jgi:hypothetical protein
MLLVGWGSRVGDLRLSVGNLRGGDIKEELLIII